MRTHTWYVFDQSRCVVYPICAHRNALKIAKFKQSNSGNNGLIFSCYRVYKLSSSSAVCRRNGLILRAVIAKLLSKTWPYSVRRNTYNTTSPPDSRDQCECRLSLNSRDNSCRGLSATKASTPLRYSCRWARYRRRPTRLLGRPTLTTALPSFRKRRFLSNRNRWIYIFILLMVIDNW